MPERVGRREIEREFRRLAGYIETPTEFTLFGGCSMSVRGVKTTTKDTDVVVHTSEWRAAMLDIQRAGYDSSEFGWWDPSDNFAMVSRPGGISIDLFPPHRMFDGPGFTQSMAARREPWFEKGRLHVFLADLSTVFLFKSITGRWRNMPGRDIDDLALILSRNLVDWRVVAAEWPTFAACGGEVVERAREAVEALRGMGLTIPWQP